MPHFIAIHRFNSDATRKVYCSENGEPMTQKAWDDYGL